jgi:glucoamylase
MKVFDLIDPAYDRYVRGKGNSKTIEVWKFNRQVRTVTAGTLLRVQASSPFLLHWTNDEWEHPIDTRSQATGIGIDFVDIPLPHENAGPIRFTFLWLEENRWEGKDYTIEVQASKAKLEARPRRRNKRKAHVKRAGAV